MNLGRRGTLVIVAWAWLAGFSLAGRGMTSICAAQNPSDRPDPAGQTSQPVEKSADDVGRDAQTPDVPESTPDDTKPQAAVVIAVEGAVDWAAAGASPLAVEGWMPVKAGDQLLPGTLIRTGLRSSLNLKFGETTAIAIRSATFASIDQFYRSATTERVRIGLGYGTVRGGSSEGTIHADVQVDSPVATLAKRGTEGWEIEIEPVTGRFRVSLAQFGLIEAVQKLSGTRTATRTVRPGEYATSANIANMWLRQDIFDRAVAFYEVAGLTEADASFAAANNHGASQIAPGAGAAIHDAGPRAGASAGGRVGSLPTTIVTRPNGVPAAPFDRPEGNFGTPDTFPKTALLIRQGAFRRLWLPRAEISRVPGRITVR